MAHAYFYCLFDFNCLSEIHSLNLHIMLNDGIRVVHYTGPKTERQGLLKWIFVHVLTFVRLKGDNVQQCWSYWSTCLQLKKL